MTDIVGKILVGIVIVIMKDVNHFAKSIKKGIRQIIFKGDKKMIKIIEKGQKTFIRTCDRCGCKFQYDLSDLSIVDHIICPCCNTTLIHIGPNDKKVGHNDTDLSKTTFTPNKDHQSYTVKVGDAGYTYGTTTGQYVNPNTATTISDINKSGSDCVTGKVDPSISIYANKLPDSVK